MTLFRKDPEQDWQQHQINVITLRMILIATLATLIAAGVAMVLRDQGFGQVRPELLFLPWCVVLVYGVSIAFRAGVAAERERAARHARMMQEQNAAQ